MKPNSISHLARLALLFVFIAALLIPALRASATAPGAPQPASTFDKASGLGLTGPYNVSSTIKASSPANLNGILLKVSSRGIYYFYLQTESTNTFTFNLYADKALSRTSVVLRLYDGTKKEIAKSSAPSCKETKPCTATLISSGRPKGAYTLKVELPTASTAYNAWLTSNMSVNTGISSKTAWPWLNRVTLYGQIPETSGNQYFKANLLAGTRYTLKLWGSSGSNLNVYVYSQSSASRPIASGTSSSYPETVTFTVPGKDFFVYIKVENAKKTNAEYYMMHTP
jgi:hypothetical protein